MKSKFLILPLLAGVKMALATGHSHEPPKTPSDPPIIVGVDSRSSANAGAESRSSAESDSTSSSEASSNSNSGGNSLSTSSVYKGVRQAPGVFTSSTNTTAPCQGSWNVGGSIPGAGLGFGKSRTNKDCMYAELAAAELARGNLQASILLRCKISYYREALGDDCEALLNTQTKKSEDSATTRSDRAADRIRLLREVSK